VLVLSRLAREKSLVPKCSKKRPNWSDILKGIFQNDIREFESWHPSRPPRVTTDASRADENSRHLRDLARTAQVWRAKEENICRGFFILGRAVSPRDFSISVHIR
jgi:hypothetical protein